MAPIDERSFFFWIGIILLVSFVSATGMLLNRYLTFRAHRRALADMHLRAVSAEYQVIADGALTHSGLKNIPASRQE